MLKIFVTTVVYNQSGFRPEQPGNIRTDVITVGDSVDLAGAERILQSLNTNIRLQGSDTWIRQIAIKLW